MAKKQNKNKPNIQKVKPQTQGKQPNKLKEQREPSKNELLFFRIGVSLTALVLVVAAIFMIVNHYLDEEAVDPYLDYQHFQTEQVEALTEKIDDTTYGNLDYFVGLEDFETFRTILSTHDVFYLYFYNSEAIDQDIQAEIENLSNIEDLPIIFIDITFNTALYESTAITHLGLDQTINDTLVIYDMQPAAIDEFFETITDIEDIIAAIQNI